jgi:hypothetical protein
VYDMYSWDRPSSAGQTRHAHAHSGHSNGERTENTQTAQTTQPTRAVQAVQVALDRRDNGGESGH